MSSIEERVTRLEGQTRSTGRFVVQFVAAPALLLCLGFWLNQILEHDRAALAAQESSLKRLQEVRLAADGLFANDPAKVKLAEFVLENLLGREAAGALVSSVRGQTERVAQERAMDSVDDFALRLKNEGAAISAAVDGALRQRRLFIVVGSYSTADSASNRFEELLPQNPSVAVRQATNGFFAVTLGPFASGDATVEAERVRGSWAADAYLSDGNAFVKQLRP